MNETVIISQNMYVTADGLHERTVGGFKNVFEKEETQMRYDLVPVELLISLTILSLITLCAIFK